MKLDLAKLNPRLAHCRKDDYITQKGVRIPLAAIYEFSEQELSDLLNTVLALQKRKSPELLAQGLGEDSIGFKEDESGNLTFY